MGLVKAHQPSSKVFFGQIAGRRHHSGGESHFLKIQVVLLLNLAERAKGILKRFLLILSPLEQIDEMFELPPRSIPGPNIKKCVNAQAWA